MSQHSGVAGVFCHDHPQGASTLSLDEATDRLREFSTWKIFAPTADDVLSAVALHKQWQLSFWDAMVVEAAAQSGCDLLWTEDLNDGQLLRGVRIRNPFSPSTRRQRPLRYQFFFLPELRSAP